MFNTFHKKEKAMQVSQATNSAFVCLKRKESKSHWLILTRNKLLTLVFCFRDSIIVMADMNLTDKYIT